MNDGLKQVTKLDFPRFHFQEQTTGVSRINYLCKHSFPVLKINYAPEKRFLLSLAGIILAGAVLRFRDLGSVSMTADEVSALLRLQFHSFGEMIDKGVRPDGHPAFVQVLLWFWTKWFGLSEFAVRLPFAIFGTASIWLAAITARKWFGDATAIATAAGMAFLKFPLMYSQLARPYAAGLFFTLLAAWYLTAFLQNEKIKKSQIAGFAIAAAGAAYSHYFSLLEVALFGMIGFFFIPKSNRKTFLVACGIAVALFLPYFGIFLDQLKTGGIGGPGGWLGKPSPAFFMAHLQFVFNDSALLLFIALGICLGTALLFFKKPDKKQILALLFWILPLLIGYVYSVARNPVLQDSVLLFGFPFLLMLLFSWLPDLYEKKIAPVFPAVIALGLLYYAAGYKPYVLTDHFGRLKELVELATTRQEQNGKLKTDIAYNVDAPYFVGYYYDRLGKKETNVLTTINNGDQELNAFRKLVANSDADYFIYAWSTKYSPLEIPEIIREKFPYLIERNYWFNSAFYVFAKSAEGMYISESTDEIFRSCNYFEPQEQYSVTETDKNSSQNSPYWSKPCSVQLQDSSVLKKDTIRTNSPYTYSWVPGAILNYDTRLDSACNYSSGLKVRVGDVLINPDNQLMITTNIKLIDENAVAILVIQFERDGKMYSWNGRESGTQTDLQNTKDWQPVYFGMQFPGEVKADDQIRVMLYTKDGKALLVDNLCFKITKGHEGIYGPRPDIEQ